MFAFSLRKIRSLSSGKNLYLPHLHRSCTISVLLYLRKISSTLILRRLSQQRLFYSDMNSNINFSQRDFPWVKNVFMDNIMQQKFNLERKYGFRLLIAQRDWLAGRTIRYNIAQSIATSRRAIIILSR